MLRGLGAWSGALLRIPEDGGALLVNPTHARMKRTLTVARELGHAALGHQAHALVEPDAPLGMFTAADPAEGTRAEEVAMANAYALALLAPYAPLLQLLEQGLSLSQIAAHFGVSVSTLTQRVRLAGVTT
jgi:Zn-dependent peptidase ImmA (M78 family)